MDNIIPPPLQFQPTTQTPPVVSPPVEEESPKSFGFFKWLLIILIVSLLSSGSTYLVLQQSQQKQQPQTVITSFPQPSPTLSPIPSPDPTIEWNTYQIVGPIEQSLGISYRLPPQITKIGWVNAGHYYKTIQLPGNSTLAIIPIGKNMGYQFNWETLQREVIKKNNFSQKNLTFMGLSSIEFSGEISNFNITGDLNLLGEGQGVFEGLLVKVDNDLALEIILYQDKTYLDFIGKTADFSSDKKIFNQILSTFKFLE